VKNVIFLAPPAAGKGTFSDYLVEKYGYLHFSTGSILREKSKNNTKLKEILESGELVRDEVILPVIEEVLKEIPKNTPFILDGFPRTLQQAKKLDIILSGLEISDVVVVEVDVEKETLKDRVIGREVCSKCYRSYNQSILEFKPKVAGRCDDCQNLLTKRDDDNEESFEVRYNTYLESTIPIIAYYKEKGCLKVICNNKLDQTEALNQLRSVIKWTSKVQEKSN